jgi:uncharacterized membrane protein
MGARERTYFELTLKGSEELSVRTYRLDAKVRNILFLIQKGYSTIEGILENSIFPREEVVERLRDLLRGHFVTVLQSSDNVPAPPPTIVKRPGPATIGPAAPAAPQPAAPPAAEADEADDEPEPIFFGL